MKSFPKEVRFQKALKNPEKKALKNPSTDQTSPPPPPPSYHVRGMNLLIRASVKINLFILNFNFNWLCKIRHLQIQGFFPTSIL